MAPGHQVLGEKDSRPLQEFEILMLFQSLNWRRSRTIQEQKAVRSRKVYMFKITKTVAFVLVAMAPVLGVAQRSQGRLERKPSPATTTASTAPSGTQTSSGSQQFAKSPNSFRGNPQSNAAPNTGLPVSPQSIVSPIQPIQTIPVAGQVVAPAAIATLASL